MRERLRKKLGFLTAAVMFLAMVFSNMVCLAETGTVAGANEAVLEAREGVVRVGIYHLNRDSGEYQLIRSGSGFLIGSNDSAGASTVITNYHTVHLTEEAMNTAKQKCGTDNLNLVIRVAVKRDTCIDATELNGSKGSDFSILSLSTPIHGKKPLVFAKEGSVSSTQNVYALGFPDILEYVQDDNSYTEEDVNVTKGTVSKLSMYKALEYVQHDATLNEGNSGGPLVNENGSIVGINVKLHDLVEEIDQQADAYRSLSISEITQTLKMLGIEIVYEDGDTDPQPEVSERPQESAQPQELDTAKLENAIEAFYSYEESDYTQDSFRAYEEAVRAGEAALANDSTQEQIDQAADRIADAELDLKHVEEEQDNKGEDGFPMWIPIAVIAGVAVILVVIIIIVAVSRSGKKQQSVPPVPMPGPRPPMPHDSGSDATTVLSGGGDAPTTMLSGQSQTAAVLVRLRTNENITIGRQVFALGKDQSRVDYCIAGNSSISRRHAEIRVKNGAFYLVDLNSTNGTFLNGQKIQMNQEMILKNNDRIKISDEEFQFKM